MSGKYSYIFGWSFGTAIYKNNAWSTIIQDCFGNFEAIASEKLSLENLDDFFFVVIVVCESWTFGIYVHEFVIIASRY